MIIRSRKILIQITVDNENYLRVEEKSTKTITWIKQNYSWNSMGGVEDDAIAHH